MVFKKLIGSGKTPENSGASGAKVEEGANLIRKYYLEFPKVKGSPTFLLENKLTIGNREPGGELEEGEAFISEDSIGPSHCTINLTNDILSVIDHGYATGTFVNKKKIPAGKMVILSLKDSLKAGSVPFRISVREEIEEPQAPEDAQESAEPEIGEETMNERKLQAFLGVEPEGEEEGEDSIPPIPPEATGKIKVAKMLDELPPVPSEEEPEPSKPSKPNETLENLETSEVSEVNQVSEASEQVHTVSSFKDKSAANGFIRFLGFVADLLLVGIIYQFFSNAQGFKAFLSDLPSLALSLLNLLAAPFDETITSLLERAYSLLPALKNASQFITSLFSGESSLDFQFYLSLLLLAALFRLVSSMVFGASAGQCLVGIRGSGHPLFKRLLSSLRFAFGALFLPLFWLFDFPTLFSKRSLKERLSFTRLVVPSSLKAAISVILFMPLLVLTMLSAPLFKGGLNGREIPFTPMAKVELGNYDSSLLKSYSNYFSLGIPATDASYFLPLFKFSSRGGKKALAPSFILGTLGEGSNYATVKIVRRISLVDLFKDFSQGNPMAQMSYPKINSLVHDASNTNKNFKDRAFPALGFANEVQKLLGWSMGLAEGGDILFIKNLMEENGPFIGAFLDFREKLIAIMGQELKSVQLKQFGNAIHIIGDFSNGKKTIKRLLPLNKKQTQVYEISYEKGHEANLAPLLSFNERFDGNGSKLNADPLVAFVDVLSPKASKEGILDIFEATGHAYFEFAKTALIRGDSRFAGEINKSIQGAIAVLDNHKALRLDEWASEKLTQNLNSILMALKEKDMEYFGISTVGVLYE